MTVKKNKRPILTLLLPLILWSTSTFGAEFLQAGDAFPKFEAMDQHQQTYQFKPGTKAVLIAFDMTTGKKANKVLAKQGAEFLQDNAAIYVSNIYGMPGIGRFFALPKMKKYPHRIILADEETLLDPFPRQENHVTVVRIDESGVVQSIAYWNPGDNSLNDYLQ
jgi:hypothetical protein